MKQIKGLFEEIRGSTKHNTFKTYTDKRKLVIMTKKPIPSYTRTDEQDQQRTLFQNAIKAWKNLSEEEKQEYAEQARPYALTGYQYFIKQYLLAPLPPGIWYKVTIDNTKNSNDLTDYQVIIDISNDAQFFTDAENKREAIRLYDSDISTLLSYWIEEWDTTNHNAKIWVKVPSIPADDKKYIYISIDPSRTEDASDGEATFDFFDDFEGTSIDTNKWGGNIASFSIGNGIISCETTSQWIYTKTYQITDGIVEAKVKIDTGARGSLHARSNQADHYSSSTVISYSINYRYPNGDVRARYWNGTTENVLDAQSYTHDTDWHIARIKMNGTQLIFEYEKYDGTNVYTFNTTHTDITSGYIGIATDAIDSGDVYYDWVRVRKYADPEPSISYQKET